MSVRYNSHQCKVASWVCIIEVSLPRRYESIFRKIKYFALDVIKAFSFSDRAERSMENADKRIDWSKSNG